MASGGGLSCIVLHLLSQPFGQVPAFQDGDLILSGEIANARFLLRSIRFY
jgi:hypothetical protein